MRATPSEDGLTEDVPEMAAPDVGTHHDQGKEAPGALEGHCRSAPGIRLPARDTPAGAIEYRSLRVTDETEDPDTERYFGGYQKGETDHRQADKQTQRQVPSQRQVPEPAEERNLREGRMVTVQDDERHEHESDREPQPHVRVPVDILFRVVVRHGDG